MKKGKGADGMQIHGFLNEAVVFLLATVVVVPLFERLKASPLLGYLLAGVALGPHLLGVVADVERVGALAEFGIVVLLFTIGLELTLDRLKTVRRRVLTLGFLQIAVTALALGAGARYLGVGMGGAIVLGGALAFSSTAVVLQLLIERHEISTRLGRTAVAILLLQDLALGPFLVLIPVLGGQEGNVAVALPLAMAKALLVLGAIALAGRYVLRPLFDLVTKAKAPELFMGCVLLVILATGAVSAAAGLSMALGAFVAGMLLADSEHRRMTHETIQPFRGLLMGLFFFSVGLSIDLTIAVTSWREVLALAFALLVIKASLIYGAARALGSGKLFSLRLGLLLAQGGDFAFVLAGLAAEAKVLPLGTAQLVSVSVALTMAVTPILASIGGRLSRRYHPQEAPGTDMLAAFVGGLQDHVVIMGLGRVGGAVARRFKGRDVPFVAIESDRAKVIDARAQGLPAFHADAVAFETLEAAQVERAQAVIVALGAERGAAQLVAALRYLFPALRILARARTEAQGRDLMRAGADEVVVEQQEASDRLAGAVAVPVIPERHL
jgi:CPA2 family monovalent cation:H+ antiporter-2